MADASTRRKHLTDLACKTAKAESKPLKLPDSLGLYLYVTPTGHKGWRMKYRIGKTEKLLTLGNYPAVPLSKARELRDEARRQLQDGLDPAEEKKARADRIRRGMDPSTIFEVIARKWYVLTSPQWKEVHARDVLYSLEQSVFPSIGNMAIAEIRPSHIRALCQKVQERGAIETAHRVRQRISAIYGYAIAEELVELDPSATIRKALKPVVRKRQPALVKLPDAQAFLLSWESKPGYPAVKLASRLLALTAVRPGVIHLAEPAEFEDLDGPEPVWRIPAAKLKLEKSMAAIDEMEFIVPLSRQAVAVVKAALSFANRRKYLFPSARHSHGHLSDVAMSKSYREHDGFKSRHVPHGWRATFSTVMNERALDADRAGDRTIIDLMLAHVQPGVEPLYNRAAYMNRRRQIAQEWADLLIDDRFCDPRDFISALRRSIVRLVRYERRRDREPDDRHRSGFDGSGRQKRTGTGG